MKKLLLGAIVALGLTTFITTSNAANEGAGWTPIQFSVWPGVTNWPDSYNVDGVKFGVPFSWNDSGTNQVVNGFELALASQSRNVNGLQIAILIYNNYRGSGVQLAYLNWGDNYGGVQIGAANWFSKSAGVQIGVLNAADANCNAYQFAAVNVNTINGKGAQFGAINSSSNFDGFQLGVLNIDDDLNVPGRAASKALQIGLINYMSDGFIPFMILFNFSL
ncbi:MAG TPA: hypothetical protein DD381_03270 [Lentisphaeria bacterium]|nr:MAG: hypothetical protein A2X47_02980 [Lentisphaerae bacterium GWF2_38_69]HBM15353.1 hypothetical protein [Lentisphaeria bacterium]